MKAARLRDWQTRLAAYFRERRDARYAPGSQDCAMFAAGAVLAMTGEDPADGFRGGYSTDAQAEAILKAGGGIERMAEDRLGPRIDPKLANVGDVGVAILAGHRTLVVCAGMHWLGPGADGTVFVRPEDVRRAWRA